MWAAFSRGAIALPQMGMGVIADQLAASLPVESIRLRTPVAQLDGTQVVLASGERLSAEALVLATDYATAATLGESRFRRHRAVRRPVCTLRRLRLLCEDPG